MPSTTIQSRISAFEALSSTGPSSPPDSNVHRPVPRPPQAQTSNNSHHLQPPLSPTLAALLSSQIPLAPSKSQSRSPSPSPPNLGRKTSLIDLKDWVLDDGLTPNGALNGNNADLTSTPTQSLFSNVPEASSSNPPAAANAPLINLESPRPKPKPKPPAISAKPVELKAPPLPPRKPSYASLKSISSASSSPIQRNGSATAVTPTYPPRRNDSLTVEHTYPPPRSDLEPRQKNGLGHAPSSSISSFHSVSLSSDTDPSTPGSMSNFIATYPVDHDRDSSHTSNASEADSGSLDDSFENVSTPSMASPSTERMISLDWENAMSKRNPIPPKLPQRPGSSRSSNAFSSRPPSFTAGTVSTPTSPRLRATLSATSSSATIASMARRPPPPPPASARSSDRSSIQSTGTSFSFASSTTTHRANSITSTKLKRPTPVPPAARKRFEDVFNGNVIQRRKADRQRDLEKPLVTPQEARRTRQAAGWRGLSVDLITAGDESPVIVRPEDARPDAELEVDEIVGQEERLDGRAVRLIWEKSGLPKERLKAIWYECDAVRQGSLDREQFVRGMWRIDEDLRRAQSHSQSLKKSTSVTFGSLGRRNTLPVNAHKMPSRPRAILR